MKFAIFEYAYAFGDENFIAEGNAMLNLIVDGLKKENIQTKKIKINNLKNYKEEILSDVKRNDFSILIAPNYELLEICKFLYENGVYEKVLISPIDSIENTLNKWNLYKKLNKEILMPKTEIFNEINVNNINSPFILKPIYGTGCENTFLYYDNKKILKFDSNFIIQEFVDGIPCSVSLFCSDEPYTVSLNFQRIKFSEKNGAKKLEYGGGIVPYDIHNKKIKQKIFEISKKVCKILNLKGYIGIDFVIKNKKIYLIEVNPRITTSAIALQKSSNINVAKLHFLCFGNKKEKEELKNFVSNIEFSKVVKFYKYKDHLKFYYKSLNAAKNNNLLKKQISGILCKNKYQ